MEFQTGHALWALAEAGISRNHPQVRKGAEYLLNRQQAFGGWLDPLQSFENFRTPFRETRQDARDVRREYRSAWNSGLRDPDLSATSTYSVSHSRRNFTRNSWPRGVARQRSRLGSTSNNA